ncbi:pentapeptide repeat-containing protein [Microbispora triticiradicis]|uniref:pentapeptide repeat-containing protein n=1 Tax=Microbispora TaxID=2005 RepID=UPI00142EB877|nr:MULTISPECIES: pentapeptide repeat-containing protein [Microbispora]
MTVTVIATPQVKGTDIALARNDAIRTALATAAGLGAAVTLLLALRRQRHQELNALHTEYDGAERRATELYTKAVEQLGHENAPVRLGGLYALERLGQNDPDHRQTIVDVICAYLRMPYTPPDDDWRRESDAASRPAGPWAVKDHSDAPDLHQEKEVRLTAQRILTAHLRNELDPEPSWRQPLRRYRWKQASVQSRFWKDIRLDLTGATLIDFDFSVCSTAAAWFPRATFTGHALFPRATFTQTALFHGATFTGHALFYGAAFTGDASFSWAAFTGDARFSEATFARDALFDRAAFARDAVFDRAAFTGDARFSEATFARDALFDRATFTRDASFSWAAFTRDALFAGATFTGHALCYGANFTGDASFSWAAFTGDARFNEATFARDALFDRATFTRDAVFDRATFARDAVFSEATFTRDARFSEATFTRSALFDRATFRGDVNCQDVTFKELALFADIQPSDVTFRFDLARVTHPDRPHRWPPGWSVVTSSDGQGQLEWADTSLLTGSDQDETGTAKYHPET